MKRLLSFAIITLALIVAAPAQYRPSGPAPSVTSNQQNAVPGSPVFSGPGASVTSGSFSPVFPSHLGVRSRRRTHGGFGHGQGQGRFTTPFAPSWAYAPTFVPVPVPVDVTGNPVEAMPEDAEAEDEAPAYTVFERRSRSAIPPPGYNIERSTRGYDGQSATESRPEPTVPDQPATLLIFRDGHQLEITNYAIQSGTLFNLSDKGPRKIALADLDVDKTMKANDERGVDFTLPATR